MATLATLVSQLPLIIRSRYDFTTFWIPKGNDLLNEINQYIRFIDNIKTMGLEVSGSHWITPPSDYRSAIDVYFPTSKDSKYHWDEINGKIRIEEVVDVLSGATDHNLRSFTTGSCVLELSTTVNGTYDNYLLVISSNPYDSVLNSIVSTSEPATYGANTYTKLNMEKNFDLPLPPDGSVQGHLTNKYLVLRYVADLTILTASSSECPLSNRYEKAFLAGLRWKAEQDMEEGSEEAKYWYTEWQRELQLLQGDGSKSVQNRTYGTTVGEAAERLTPKQRERAGL